MKAHLCAGVLFIGVIVAPSAPLAHSGGVNADGCHINRKTGDYHCHRGGRQPSAASQRPAGKGDSVYYPNCAAARAAGAAPVRRGDPGYARHLDRDGDGKGCE